MKLFCIHKWQRILTYQEYDDIFNIRYGMSRIKCSKCGKEKDIASNKWYKKYDN